jgi:hypothetical protein
VAQIQSNSGKIGDRHLCHGLRRAPLEAVLGDGWSRDVFAKSLDPAAVAAVEELRGVEVDAAHFGG